MSLRIPSRAFGAVAAALCALAAAAPLAAQDKKKPNPAATPTPRAAKDKPAQDRHKQILARVAKGDVDLAFLGDSITQGWSSTGAAIWKAKYEPLKAANLGVGADATQHALWRVTKGGELRPIKPRVVVLMMGINNVANGNKPEQIAEGIAAIIKAVQANHAATKVLLVSTFPAGKAPAHKFRAPVKALNALLARMADGDRVRFVDAHDRFLDAKGHLTDAVGADGIHLTAKGYKVWADAIQPSLDALMGKPGKPAAPAGARSRWVHADGELVATGNGAWEERQKTGKFTFVERGRTAEHVELFDASRDYTLRLTATAMLIKGGKGSLPKYADFTKLRDGKFADAAPVPSGSGKLAWGQKVSADFRAKVVAIAKELGIDPSHLMACMAFETGETFKPDIVNKSSGATGLIQFLPSTARGLGTTTEALKKMTAVEQLDYVRKYFLPHKGKLKNIDDLYMAILWPVAVGKPVDYVLFTKDDAKTGKAYSQNAGLDRNKDGKVTKAEAAASPRAKLTKGQGDGLASPMP